MTTTPNQPPSDAALRAAEAIRQDMFSRSGYRKAPSESFYDRDTAACIIDAEFASFSALRTPPVNTADGAALTFAMDNVTAWKIGEACNKAMQPPAGDYIDRGLILRRVLEEAGFSIIPRAPKP